MKNQTEDIQMSVVDVTPELALRWLSNNVSNRNIRKAQVDKYCRDMTNGDWHITGAGISLGPQGELLDGQHRLSAIVKLGKPVKMLVLNGVPSGAQQYMDCGAGRTIGDGLSMFGGWGQSAQVAAIVRGLVFLDDARFDRLTLSETRTVLELYEDGVKAFTNHRRLTGGAYVKAPLVWLHENGWAPDASDFADSLASLANLEPGSPVLALDRVLRGPSRPEGTRRSFDTSMLTLTAMHAYCTGATCQTLRVSTKGYDFFRARIPYSTVASVKKCSVRQCKFEALSFGLCSIHNRTRKR